MPQPDFILVGQDRQMQRRVKPFLGFRQGQPLRRLQREPAFGHEFVCESVLHLDIVYFKQSRPTPTRRSAAGGGRAGTALPGDNWQNCRSLDESSAPVCSFYGPSGLVLSLLQSKCGVRRYPTVQFGCSNTCGKSRGSLPCCRIRRNETQAPHRRRSEA